jgi:hypothetical protein
MFFKLRRGIWQKLFDHSARAILATRPLVCQSDSQVTIVTQVYPPDVLMYLVALKTFSRFVSPRTVIVVSDRLSAREKETINAHVQPVEFLDIGTIDTHGTPRGGCWERLITIVERSASAYTIQLDADTITQSPPGEVLDCVTANRSFTLGTSMGRRVTSVADASAAVRHLATPRAHVQVAAEAAFDQLPHRDALYVRGNAAFAGFARGHHTITALRSFSDAMTMILGKEKWWEWGSEQVASNYMIANSADPLVLPFDRYRYYQPGVRIDTCPFIHFMGPHRFAHGTYRRLARQSIRTALAL